MPLHASKRVIARLARPWACALLVVLACGPTHGKEGDLSASEVISDPELNAFDGGAPVIGYRDLKALLVRYDQDDARRTAKFKADAAAAVASAQAKGTTRATPPPAAPAPAQAQAAGSIDAATLQTPEFQARLQRGDPAATAQMMAYIAQMRAGVHASMPGGATVPAPRTGPPISLAQAVPGGSPLGKALAMQGDPEVAVALSKVDTGNGPPFPMNYNHAWGAVKMFEYHNANHKIRVIQVDGDTCNYNVVDDNDPAYRGKRVSVEQAVAANQRAAAAAEAATPRGADAAVTSMAAAPAVRTGASNGVGWQPTRLPTRVGDGWIKLAYVGEPLSHRSDRPAGENAPRVTVSLEVMDQALAANDELRISSQLAGDRQFTRSVVVTSGDQVYDFNKPGDRVEVRIATDAMRRIVSWRIRAARPTDNDNRYIRVFGPGFEHDNDIDPVKFGVGAAGSECLGSATDIVFNRDGYTTGVDGSATRLFTQSCRPGTWQLR